MTLEARKAQLGTDSYLMQKRTQVECRQSLNGHHFFVGRDSPEIEAVNTPFSSFHRFLRLGGLPGASGQQVAFLTLLIVRRFCCLNVLA